MLQISLVFFLLPSTNIKIYNQIEKIDIIIFVVIMIWRHKNIMIVWLYKYKNIYSQNVTFFNINLINWHIMFQPPFLKSLSKTGS